MQIKPNLSPKKEPLFLGAPWIWYAIWLGGVSNISDTYVRLAALK